MSRSKNLHQLFNNAATAGALLDSTNDLLIAFDASTGEIKKVTPVNVVTAGSSGILTVNDRSATGNETVEEYDSWSINSAASGNIVLTLPTAEAGDRRHFAQTHASNLVSVKPASGDVIIWTDGSSISNATGSAETTAQYDNCTLTAIDTGTWLASSAVGTWTITT